MGKERGTALLITLVLIAVIGSVAFGVGRSSLTSFRQASRLEDSLNAYQAAQAGIEDALLRFRFNKNAEAPMVGAAQGQADGCRTADDPSSATLIFERVDITTDQRSCANLQSQAGTIAAVPTNPDHIVYDLKMYYRRPKSEQECLVVKGFTGSVPSGCTELPASVTAALPKDTSVEYDVSDTGPAITLNATFEQTTAQSQIEVIQIPDSGEATRTLYKASDLPAAITKQPGVNTIRLRPFGSNLRMYTVAPTGNGTIDSRVTRVDSIGYYGVSKRKLTLTLDRLSGTVFEVFDFVLFSGGSAICGPTATCP